MKASEIKKAIENGFYDRAFSDLYRSQKVSAQAKRYCAAIDEFTSLFGDRDALLFSVPGRSEVAGNHTDHNHGRVIAAAVDLDIIAVVCKRNDNFIEIKSEGFEADTVNTAYLEPAPERKFSSYALIAGVADGFLSKGYKIGGFSAYTTSDVIKGSGLSSSAAFEVMVGNILNHIYNGGVIRAPELAKIARYAENVHFGKPCGLMDQTACAVGGFVYIDFNTPEAPIIEKLDLDLTAEGYDLCIVNTRGSHADLNEDYASIPSEMKAVAAHFEKSVLRGLEVSDVFAELPELREKVGDRAILRALHFIDENARVKRIAEAARDDNIAGFLKGIEESGVSSERLLQNIYSTKDPSEQGLTLALEVSRRILGARGVCRVHGGGFAGTIQAFVPVSLSGEYSSKINAVFGSGSCHVLHTRNAGAIKLADEGLN